MRRILLFLSLLMLLPTFARAEKTLYSFDTNKEIVGSVDHNGTLTKAKVLTVNGLSLSLKGFGNSAGDFPYLAIGKKAKSINTTTGSVDTFQPVTHIITSGQIEDEITSISFTVRKRKFEDKWHNKPKLTGARLYIATKPDFSDAEIYPLYKNKADEVNGQKFDVVNPIEDNTTEKVITLRLTDYNEGEPFKDCYFKVEFDTDGGSNDPMWLYFQNITFLGNSKSRPTHNAPVVNFDDANKEFTLTVNPSNADSDTQRKIYYYVNKSQTDAPKQGDAQWIEYKGVPVKYETAPGNYFVHSYVAAGDPEAYQNSETAHKTNFYKVWNPVPEGKIKTVVLNYNNVSQASGVARDYADELGINYNSKALNTKNVIEVNQNSYGIATTTNTREYKVKAIEVEWANNPRVSDASMAAYSLDVYGGATAYESSDALFNGNAGKPYKTLAFGDQGTDYIEFTEAVPFIGLRAQNGTHYIKEIRIYYDLDSPIHFDYDPGFEQSYKKGATSVTTLNVVKNLKAGETHPELNITVEKVSGEEDPIVIFEQTTVPSDVSEIKFTAKNPGEAKVTVSWGRTDYWKAAQAEFNVTVIQPALDAPEITLGDDFKTFAIDATKAKATDPDCEVKYAFTTTAHAPALGSDEWKVYDEQDEDENGKHKLPEYKASDFGNDLDKVFYVYAYVEPSQYNVDNKIYSSSADVYKSYNLAHPDVRSMFIAVSDMKLADLQSVASVDFDYTDDPANGEVYQFNVGRVNDKGALTGQFNFFNRNALENVRRIEIVVKSGEVYPNKVIVATGENMLSTVQSVGVNGVKNGNNVIFDILQPKVKYFRLQATEKDRNSFAPNTTIEGIRIYYFDSYRKKYTPTFKDIELDITDESKEIKLDEDFDGDLDFGNNKIVQFVQDKEKHIVKINPLEAGTQSIHVTWGDDKWKDGSALFKITITKTHLEGVTFSKLDDKNCFTITHNNANFVDGIYYEISGSPEATTPNDSWIPYTEGVKISGNGLYYVHAYVKSSNDKCGSSPVVTTSYDVFAHSIADLIKDIDKGIKMVKSGNDMISQKSVMIRFDNPLVVYGRNNNAMYAYEDNNGKKSYIRIINIPTSNPIKADIAALNAYYVKEANGRDYFQYVSHEEDETGRATIPLTYDLAYNDCVDMLTSQTPAKNYNDYLYHFVSLRAPENYPEKYKVHYNGEGQLSILHPRWADPTYNEENTPQRVAVPDTHTNVLTIDDSAIKGSTPGFYKGIDGYISQNAAGQPVFVATRTDGDIVTSLDSIFNDGSVKVVNGAIVAPEGSEVYTISGIRIADFNVEPGMYIVRLANGKAVKVQVK